jgi:threonine/homoserine/homoserine lactone efflux protein
VAAGTPLATLRQPALPFPPAPSPQLQMINWSLILLFTPTMLLISATPGMCMTLAMTLGLSVGLRRTLWMMAGEVLGVALVASLAGIGVASVMLRYPAVFAVLKWAGGAYMVWLGLQLWRSRGALALDPAQLAGRPPPPRRTLAAQGFLTAIGNPKGWAFFLALLPPFLVPGGVNAHFLAILAVIVTSELLCMTLYASGGRTLRRLLARRGNVALINRIAGSLMLGVGIWLATS